MKKILLLMLTMVTLGFASAPLSSQTIWDGTADISWYMAGQTSFDISTPEQLAGMALLMTSQMTNFSGITINLTADIWLNADNDSTNNWIPIGGYATATSEAQNNSSAYAFSGTFKGHGHAIHNLYCDKSAYYQAGLFGCVQYPCTIDSLALINPVVKANGMSGSLIGYTLNSGSVYVTSCIAINCRVAATGNNNNGGLLGANWQMQDGSNWTYFSNCAVTGHLTGKYIGGIAGNGQKVNTSNCYFAGTLSPTNGNWGGILGHASNNKFSLNNTYCNIPSATTAAEGRDGVIITTAEMQAPAFVTTLGNAFMADNGINNGFPILSWMAGVSASATEICAGESVTLTGVGYDSYLWTPGNQTSQTITVTPTTTTTYTMTGTNFDGSTGTHSVTITVYPQAVVTASVAASADGQVHGTVNPGSATVGCGSSDDVTFTVTPDNNWRVSSILMNGTQLYGEQTYGPFTFTVNPGGTLADVVIYMTDAPTCTPPLNLSLSDIYGTNATVSWNAHTTGALSEYHIVVYDLTNSSETEYTTTDLTYTVLGLTENTSYQIGVYTFCTDGYNSDTVFVNFITPCNSPIPVTVGSGTASAHGQYFPVYTFYNYSYTQQIIPAAQLNNDAQSFNAIQFQYFLSTALTRNLDIYLAHVPATANLSSGWIQPSGTIDNAFTLVYSGNVNLNNSGTNYWFEIPFTQNFQYNGNDNLLVAVLDHTGSYTNSSEKFYTHNDASTANMSRYVYRDASTYDPFNPDASGNLSSNVNNIRFIFCDESSCIRPNTLSVANITDNSADLSWVVAGSETSWEIEYRSLSDTGWLYYGQANSTTETLLNLNADTRYYVRVRAVCGSGEYSLWTDPVSFRTLCGPITQLPYFNNFDDVISDNGTNFITCWSRLTTNPDRVVRCYSSAVRSAPYSLDFNYSPSCTTAAVTPMLDPSIPLNTVMLDFWAYSNLGQGWMEIGTMSDPNDFSTYEFYDTLRLSAPSTWENLMISFENYTGTNQYIAFLEINGTSTSYIFDDFTIDYIPVCLHPTNLVVDGLTNTTVTLSWDELGTANSWEIEYGPAGFTLGNGTTVTAYQNPFTVDNLTPATTYDFYVYANCGSDLSDPFGPVSATPGQYIFGVTGNDTITTCGLILYDDGGPSGDYSNYCDFTLVIYPENPNAVLALAGTSSTESCCDYLRVYDGVGTSGQQLAEYKGENLTVNVMSQSGPLTLVFHSDLSVIKSGFAITASCVTCYPPYGVAASNIMTTSANLNWNGSSDSYLVYLYGPDTTVIPTTDTFLLINNLQLNTTYTVAVQSLCVDGDSSSLSSPITFTTPTIPATLPYTTDFENTTDNIQWGILNGTQANKWHIGAPTDGTSDVNTTLGGANGLYVSNDNGVSNTYTGSESRVYAFRDILVPDGTTELVLSFDWKAQGGNATNEFLRVYWLDPAVVTVTAGNNPPSVGGVNYDLYGMPGYNTIGAHWLSQQNTWQHEEMLISATQFAGMGNGDHIYRLYFHWRNTSYSSNPPAAVDNIELHAVTCATPLNVAVSNVTDNSATVSWSGNASSYGVTVTSNIGSDYHVVSDTSIALTGLSAQTGYQVTVRALCGSDSSMLSQPVSFNTACGAIATLPYFENFNNYSSMGGSNYIECWSRHSSDPSNHWVYVNSGSDAYSGGSLDFHYTPNCYTMAITPMFDPSIPLNTLMIEGMTRIHLNGTAGVFEVGTVSDPSDPTTFTPYDTITYSATFTWLPLTILFNNYTGNDHYIAFRAMNGIDVSYLLDDITIDVIPSCWHPATPTVTNVTSDGATISWNGTATNYVVEYGPAGFTQGTGTTVNVTGAMTCTLTGLTSNTTYTVYIQSDCGSDGLSTAISVNFKTDCDVVALPYSENFDSYTTNSTYTDNNGIAPDCWTTYSTNTTYGPPHITSTGSYHYVHSGSNCMVFTCSSVGPNAYAALPTFNSPLNTLTLNFWRAMENTSYGTLSVGYVTDLQNISTSFVQVATIPSVGSSSGDTISVNFTIAGIPANGNICFHWFKESTYYSCCIDDILVTVSGGGPVVSDPTVATTAATNIAETSATLNGSITNPDNVTITAKGFEWKTTTGGTYTPVTVTGNSLTHNLTGLNPNTSYTYKAFIVFNGQAVYGNEMTFTTLDQGVEPCDAPTNLHATDIQNESIAITWDANSNVTSWNIQYRPVGGQLASASSNTNSYTITGLTGDTDYEIQVQAVCANGTSDWTSAITVHTTDVGIENWLNNSVVLFPNPAKEYVDIRVDGDLNVTTMEVYDVYGKLINTVGVCDTPVQTRTNISNLANGMYFVRVTTETGVVTKSFVKK